MQQPMKLIPVLDLMNGGVVHAQRGERGSYAPIRSKLCPSHEAAAIVSALLELHAFDTFYIADLDAIQRRGNHFALIASLRKRFAQIEFWIDAGLTGREDLDAFRAARVGTAVLGSESFSDIRILEETPRQGHAVILSLDFKDGAFLGPRQVLQREDLWPHRLLAMNLSRVGSGLGPDLELIATLQARRADCEVYAAGGVRHREDLLALKACGARGALIATALHSGALSRAELQEFSD
jgi:phosphoribosylformimino-5-aminoimidazole carboxamide ribotide isomerase